MQKYTRSSRSTTRGTSIESTEESAPSTSSATTAAGGGARARQSTVVVIPEPIRRWHSFHSRRSSFGHSAAPHLPVVVTGSAAGATPTAPPVTKPAARFLSPPPLTPRRRFSVWYKTRINSRKKENPFFLFLLLFAGLDSQSLSISRIDSPCTYPPSLLSLCCSAPTCSEGGVYFSLSKNLEI